MPNITFPDSLTNKIKTAIEMLSDASCFKDEQKIKAFLDILLQLGREILAVSQEQGITELDKIKEQLPKMELLNQENREAVLRNIELLNMVFNGGTAHFDLEANLIRAQNIAAMSFAKDALGQLVDSKPKYLVPEAQRDRVILWEGEKALEGLKENMSAEDYDALDKSKDSLQRLGEKVFDEKYETISPEQEKEIESAEKAVAGFIEKYPHANPEKVARLRTRLRSLSDPSVANPKPAVLPEIAKSMGNVVQTVMPSKPREELREGIFSEIEGHIDQISNTSNDFEERCSKVNSQLSAIELDRKENEQYQIMLGAALAVATVLTGCLVLLAIGAKLLWDETQKEDAEKQKSKGEQNTMQQRSETKPTLHDPVKKEEEVESRKVSIAQQVYRFFARPFKHAGDLSCSSEAGSILQHYAIGLGEVR